MERQWYKTTADEHIIYDRRYVKDDVWAFKVSKRITIYLIDKPNYDFCVSAGANSESSYSGCFFGHPEVANLVQAMEGIKIKHPDYFK